MSYSGAALAGLQSGGLLAYFAIASFAASMTTTVVGVISATSTATITVWPTMPYLFMQQDPN